MSKKTILWIVFGCLILILVSIGIPVHTNVVVKPQCVENLKMIQVAKIRWMNDNNKTLDDTPTWDDIKPLLGGKNDLPICPKGGTYTLGKVGEFPKCSIGGPEHSIPPHAFPSPYHP